MDEKERQERIRKHFSKLSESIVRRAKEEDERRITLADSEEAEHKIEDMIDKRGWSIERYNEWRDKLHKGVR